MSDIIFEYEYDGDDGALVRAIADGKAFVCDGLPVHLPGAIVSSGILFVPLPNRILQVDLAGAMGRLENNQSVRIELHFHR